MATVATTMAAITWLKASGRKPASSGIWASAANKDAEAEAGQDTVDQPGTEGPRPRSSAGSEATSQIAGSATSMPAQTIAPGRSPVARPTTTGTRAAPTPETGATTPIRPEERPR